MRPAGLDWGDRTLAGLVLAGVADVYAPGTPASSTGRTRACSGGVVMPRSVWAVLHWVVCFLSGRGGVRVRDVDSTGECRDLEQLLMRQERRKGWRADVLTHGALA